MNAADSTTVEQAVMKPGMDGMRAAMYAEMAKAASGRRPWLEHETDWDAALEAAITFIQRSGFDEATSRQLLGEASATRLAGDARWDTSVGEVCQRLSAEFRTCIERG